MFARPSFTQTTMVNRPPKPPCWRDFVPDSNTSRQKQTRIPKSVEFTDIVKLPVHFAEEKKTKNSCISSSKRHTSQKDQPKKSSKKLHRTRSQTHIEQTDLPEKEIKLTQSLAETKARDLQLHKRVLDAKIYLDENTRRCAEWLEGVKACEPLDDVDFAQGNGVEVEMPDELADLRPPQNSSASSSDLENLHVRPNSSCHSCDARIKSYIVTDTDVHTVIESDDNSKSKKDSFELSNKENHSSHDKSLDSKILASLHFQYKSFCVEHNDIKLENT